MLLDVSTFTSRMLIASFIFCSLLIQGTVSYAQQTGFKTNNSQQQTTFNFQWRQNDQTYNLMFAIPTNTLYAMPDSPATYNQNILQETVYRSVMMEAKKIDPTLANIKVSKRNDGLSFNVQSKQPSQAQLILARLKKTHQEAQDDYWADNMFSQFTSATGENGIRHDHGKYTVLSSEALQPIVEAIKSIQQQPNNPREFVQIALSWIQNIPYNTLESRLTSNGAGFVSPRDLLLQNQGDCDSKSTLLAAVLKAYNPRIDIQMVYLPNHALLGLAMRQLPNEMTVTKKGIRYVLLEPTGPAQFVIGEVADSSKLALRNRQFDMVSL